MTSDVRLDQYNHSALCLACASATVLARVISNASRGQREGNVYGNDIHGREVVNGTTAAALFQPTLGKLAPSPRRYKTATPKPLLEATRSCPAALMISVISYSRAHVVRNSAKC